MAKFATTMHKKHKDIKCVCTTIVGPFDTDRYVVLSHQSLEGYSDVNVRKEFAKYCKLPIYADNDVKAAALGELHSGALKGLTGVNAIVMAIGTGIAGCPIINSQVYRGSNFSSGECGQMLVNNHHFEMYYGVPFFIARCEQIYGKELTGEKCLELAKTNVSVKREVDE
jgi:predicted NBD/HSP70 family sugar kinase